MVNMMIVNNEQCVVRDNKHCVMVKQHAPHSRQTPEHKVCAVLRACSQSCARTTRHTPFQNKEKRKRRKKGEERRKRNKRVVLDGGGARLADAATRHHLTQTRKTRREENSGEQNKHTRTQTIQKTSTRTSTSHGHHTLPSMRNQTPIQQQW